MIKTRVEDSWSPARAPLLQVVHEQCYGKDLINPFQPQDAASQPDEFLPTERGQCPICDYRVPASQSCFGRKCSECGTDLTFAGPSWVLACVFLSGIGGVAAVATADRQELFAIEEIPAGYAGLLFLIWIVTSVSLLFRHGRYCVMRKGRKLTNRELLELRIERRNLNDSLQ